MCRPPGQLVMSAGSVVRKPLAQKQADGKGAGKARSGSRHQLEKQPSPSVEQMCGCER